MGWSGFEHGAEPGGESCDLRVLDRQPVEPAGEVGSLERRGVVGAVGERLKSNRSAQPTFSATPTSSSATSTARTSATTPSPRSTSTTRAPTVGPPRSTGGEP